MFTIKIIEKKPTFLEETIESLLHEMSVLDGNSDEYTKMADNLVKLYKLQEEEKSSKKQVSPDTVVLVLGNLLGIAMIVGHERAGIVTSKALNFLGKLK